MSVLHICPPFELLKTIWLLCLINHFYDGFKCDESYHIYAKGATDHSSAPGWLGRDPNPEGLKNAGIYLTLAVHFKELSKGF